MTLNQTSFSSMRLWQILWIVLALFSIGKFVLSEAVYYEGIHEICIAPVTECHDRQQATVQDAARLRADGLSLEAWALGNIAYRTLLALVFCAVGLAIFARKRDDPAILFNSLCLILFGTLGGFVGFLADRFPEYGLWLNLIQFPAWLAVAVFFFSFPSGRVVPRGMWLVIGLWTLLFLPDFLIPGLDKTSGWYSAFSNVVWFSLFIGAVVSQVYRYVRVSNAEQRRQTKWVVFGIAIFVAVPLILYGVLGALLDNSAPYSASQLLVVAILNLTSTAIPITIGIAILREQLFDIDVIIRRTLIYSALTAMLAAVYFGSVVVLQQLLSAVTGPAPQIAIIVSTLVIAALFLPLRSWIQRVIDRRFYRRKYDSQQVLAKFATMARDEVDLSRVTGELLAVIDQTMQPEKVSVWLMKGK